MHPRPYSFARTSTEGSGDVPVDGLGQQLAGALSIYMNASGGAAGDVVEDLFTVDMIG